MQFTLESFAEIALGELPALREEFEDNAGLAYVQMGAFARLLEAAKERGDWAVYRRGAMLADRLWAGADDGLRNALNVSLLESIDFDGPGGSHAWGLLSGRLQRAWRAMAAYNEWLHAGAKGEPPAEAEA